jgi:DNA-binding CsgD family transcriptional regulator
VKVTETQIRRFCDDYGLSPRQTKVFRIFAKGALSDSDICRRLRMKRGTVNTHFARICEKTQTGSRIHLLYLFFSQTRRS